MQFSHQAVYSSRRSPVFARNMVAGSQPIAVEAGLAMLRHGGNAMDAALATAIALVVVEPTGNGLGSDAFCIVWDGRDLHGLNASGRSPADWNPQRFAGRSQMPERGWDSVTVPGAVSAWVELSRRFGRLPFAKLFEPAIEYAERGFHLTPVIAEVWRRGAETLKDSPGFAAAFMPGGEAPRAGELFRNPPLGSSLRRIAESEGESFYRGDLAERMVAFAEAHGAALSMGDLASHANDWCGTITKSLDGVTLHEIPPNGQGIAALMAVGMLQHVGISELACDSPAALHLQVEAIKLAFADVDRYVADADFMNDVSAEMLLDDGYLAGRARLIDRNRAQDFGAGAPKEGGTVCLAAADANGMMVSYIQSNYSGFGSGVVVPETGISFQNRGFGFSLLPGHPNEVAPRKRPFHTIIPGFVMRDGSPTMAFGLMGGPMQAQGHVQMFLRTQVWGQDPQTAVDAPRWRAIEGLRIAIEPAVPDDTVQRLESLGHHIEREAPEANFGFGGAQLVHKIDGGYVGGSDPRKDGLAAGF